MIHMLGQAVFGLIVGIVAHMLVGGHGGWLWDIILGLAGGWVGGQLGKWVGWYDDGGIGGFALAVLGASLLVIVGRYVL